MFRIPAGALELVQMGGVKINVKSFVIELGFSSRRVTEKSPENIPCPGHRNAGDGFGRERLPLNWCVLIKFPFRGGGLSARHACQDFGQQADGEP